MIASDEAYMQEFRVFGLQQSWLSGSGTGGAIVLIVAILGALGIWKMSNKWWATLFLGVFFVVANYWDGMILILR